MKTLYIHVGMPKTGTTAIQHFCADNRLILEKNNFCYPIFPFRYPGKTQKRNALFLVSTPRDKDGKLLKKKGEKRFRSAFDEINKKFQTYDNVILSDESIWPAMKIRRPELWNELREIADRDGYTIKLIVYLRRQDNFVVSAWNQRIKKPINTLNATNTWDDFLEACPNGHLINLDYYHTLQSAADALGKENIIVRRYDRRFLKGGLSQIDFLDILGLELTDEYVIDRSIVNKKLSLNGCEIKRIINGIEDISIREHQFFQDSLTSIAPLSEREYPNILWSAADAAAFMDRYKEDNQKIADTFIQDGHPLFDDSFTDGEVWERDNPQMFKDFIRFTAASDLQLFRAWQELQTEIQENLKKEIQSQQALLQAQNREIQDLKKQLAEVRSSVDMLRQFRLKVKHPFKTLFRSIFRKS